MSCLHLYYLVFYSNVMSSHVVPCVLLFCQVLSLVLSPMSSVLWIVLPCRVLFLVSCQGLSTRACLVPHYLMFDFGLACFLPHFGSFAKQEYSFVFSFRSCKSFLTICFCLFPLSCCVACFLLCSFLTRHREYSYRPLEDIDNKGLDT